MYERADCEYTIVFEKDAVKPVDPVKPVKPVTPKQPQETLPQTGMSNKLFNIGVTLAVVGAGIVLYKKHES